MKDRFSRRAASYSKYRPDYPNVVYDQLFSEVATFDRALDCATGSGQVAHRLAAKFNRVNATDISIQQLSQAIQKDNIKYDMAQAEQQPFANDSFDLITVAQAIHWFDFGDFFMEVQRLSKPDGIFAAFGYGLIQLPEKLNDIVSWFYNELTDPYWDHERKHIDSKYKTIPFPDWNFVYHEFEMHRRWSYDDLIGFFQTWSVVQKMEKQGLNPISELEHAFRQNISTDDAVDVLFSGFLHLAKVPK